MTRTVRYSKDYDSNCSVFGGELILLLCVKTEIFLRCAPRSFSVSVAIPSVGRRGLCKYQRTPPRRNDTHRTRQTKPTWKPHDTRIFVNECFLLRGWPLLALARHENKSTQKCRMSLQNQNLEVGRREKLNNGLRGRHIKI